MLPLLWGAVLGLCTGSFANVFLHRYPRGLSLFWPASRCPQCQAPVRWRHNIPVLGWLFLRGRCKDCGRAIPSRYPLVEAAFGLLAVLIVGRFGAEASTWAYLAFFMALLLAALCDWQTQYLYDVITVPLGVLGLGMSAAFPELLGGQWASPVAMLGMLATMLALQGLGRWLAGRDALGGGDVKLMAAAAGFLGWPHAWLALLLGSLAGLPLLLLYRRLHGGDWEDPVPFGPALCLGCAWAAWDLLAGGTQLVAWLGFGPLH
jgi:leader peptidase (prepilin peptidase) / N-methyltransferase